MRCPPPRRSSRGSRPPQPGFTFALKFPRRISHEKRLVDCTEETLALLDALRALGATAAPAFLQLPPDCTRRTCGRALAAYLDWLAPLATDLRLAVEVRAADLMTPAFATFLAERGLALVLVDRQGTPDLYPIWQDVMATRRAPAFLFIRWIGDDRSGPKGDRESAGAPRRRAHAVGGAHCRAGCGRARSLWLHAQPV
jgi:uncharacterized protein YecE (DUF72 family)